MNYLNINETQYPAGAAELAQTLWQAAVLLGALAMSAIHSLSL